MNKHLPLIALVVLLTTSCAPQVTATSTPQTSEVSETSEVLTPTPLPALTPTPIAVDGIAEDVKGNKLAYLDGKWVALPEFAEEQADDVDRVVVLKPGTKDQRIVALDAEDVELYEVSTDGTEWVKVEKVYTSGADPELQAEVIAEAEAVFGMSVAEKMESLDRKWPSFKDETKGIYREQMMYLKYKELSFSHMPGAHATDSIVLSYFSAINTQDLVPRIEGYTYQGVFYQTGFILPSLAGGTPMNRVETIDELKAFLDTNVEAGDVLEVQVQTFVPDMTSGEWKQFDADNRGVIFGINGEQQLKLIALQNNDYLKRMAGNGGNVRDVLKLLDPTLGDWGLFARGAYMVDED